MFTGIVAAVGTISKIKPTGKDISLTVNTGKLDLSDVQLGDSIATNGVCLTVTALGSNSFSADLSVETLKLSSFAHAKVGSLVNLEKAMMPQSRFGGHIVSGHVDGVATVISRHDLGRATEFWLSCPPESAKYIAHKGSITVDGISLTVNEVNGCEFKLTIVPHTSGETTITHFKAGTQVNLEVDLIARYLERLLLGDKAAEKAPSGVTMSLLAESGFLK
ncbi:riboflavin synthase [Motilimonas cestriensis]|uniref:Riboflavin synthase n=1 Tax=Motilimonas cestriensis TaxID=2742685 RepID=A0ABS8WC57_9GAMM|nr:riboflavin synthase [Motilimonas cestriensis]MCE2595907.1 riboflavin synthase [Motilimonas cestriensis]